MTRIFDCDVHCPAPAMKSLYRYLSDPWPDYLSTAEAGYGGSGRTTYPPWSQMLATDAATLTLDAVRQDVLAQADGAILHCYFGVEGVTHPYLATELATAINRWVQDEWLDHEPRLAASATITPQFVPEAVAEIHRIAQDPRFVEILLPCRSQEAYGNQRYWPIWEAAAEHGLPIGISGGGAIGIPPTPVNWMSNFFEDYVTWVLNYETQLISLVMSGVFQQWPNLKVTMLESGWTWLPGFMWRMDAEWKQSRREVPWIVDPPSSYVRRHFRFSTQPTDTPESAEHLRDVLDQVGDDEVHASEMLMYGSDYPHRYGGGLDEILVHLSEEEQERVRYGNAAGWYRGVSESGV